MSLQQNGLHSNLREIGDGLGFEKTYHHQQACKGQVQAKLGGSVYYRN